MAIENATPEINENAVSEMTPKQDSNKGGWLNGLGWFFSGFVLPMGSFTYYRKAAQKSVGIAVLFFSFFTITISILTTIKSAVNMFSVMGTIEQMYADGSIPVITISNGIAEVEGEQPFIIFADRSQPGSHTFVATDTSGQITRIDTSLYDQGFLLTRTELHVVDRQNDYQVLPLSELHVMFEKDPIILDAETVSRVWVQIAVVLVILLFLWLVFWFTIVRLMFISTIALVVWGIVSLIKPGTGYGPIIISGLYAIVPAVYFAHLFERSELVTLGVETLLLFVFWTIALAAVFVNIPFFVKEHPLRLWTAFIGLPMLLLFVVDIFVVFPSPYGPLALWGVALFTGLMLIGARGFFRVKDASPVPVPEVRE